MLGGPTGLPLNVLLAFGNGIPPGLHMQGGPCASVGAPGTTGGDAISILGGGGITAPPGGGASFDPKALAAAAAAAATAATGLVGVPSAPLGTFPGEDEDVGMLLLKEPNADCTGNVFGADDGNAPGSPGGEMTPPGPIETLEGKVGFKDVKVDGVFCDACAPSVCTL